MASVGMPEVLVVLAVLIPCVGVPYLFYRLGYNRGYAEGLAAHILGASQEPAGRSTR